MIPEPPEQLMITGPIARPPQAARATTWSDRYGARHRLVRVVDLPAGINAPRRVRLYRRCDHDVLQWWDPAAKANLSDRVDGDLVAAVMRARQIEEQLENVRSSGKGVRRLGHDDLVERFLIDLGRRADAGVIDPATVRRYDAALGHYRAFAEQHEIHKTYPHAAAINHDFRLAFAAFLADRRAAPNGHPHATVRLMRGQSFILDTVRAMLEWAADPGRGGLLPEGFRNPFLRRAEARAGVAPDPMGEPDITTEAAAAFVRACDAYQLRLFVPLIVFGLRAAEPCFLFHEYLDTGWLRVPCNPALAYRTKGRRDKRFPLVGSLDRFWDVLRRGVPRGLLYERRSVAEGHDLAPLRGASLEDLVAELERRSVAAGPMCAAGRLRLRDAVLRDAGGLAYDHIEGEFRRLARRLSWPARATLKDFRHLFCTTLGNSAMPEAYRRYLMGHAPGRAAIVTYTHLNRLRQQYSDAVSREWSPLMKSIGNRVMA